MDDLDKIYKLLSEEETWNPSMEIDVIALREKAEVKRWQRYLTEDEAWNKVIEALDKK